MSNKQYEEVSGPDNVDSKGQPPAVNRELPTLESVCGCASGGCGGGHRCCGRHHAKPIWNMAMGTD